MRETIQITVDSSPARRAIRRLIKRMGDYRPVFVSTRLYLQTMNAANFASRGAASGEPWAVYGKWSARAGQPASLVRTGKLMDSLIKLDGPPNDIGKRSATFGTEVEYAGFHQYGTRNMPSRTIVFEPHGFSKTLARFTSQYLDTLID